MVRICVSCFYKIIVMGFPWLKIYPKKICVWWLLWFVRPNLWLLYLAGHSSAVRWPRGVLAAGCWLPPPPLPTTEAIFLSSDSQPGPLLLPQTPQANRDHCTHCLGREGGRLDLLRRLGKSGCKLFTRFVWIEYEIIWFNPDIRQFPHKFLLLNFLQSKWKSRVYWT